MKRAVFVTLLAALGATPLDAAAWESQCRVPPDPRAAPDGRYPDAALTRSICAPASEPECASGLLAARGWYTGEHRYVTEAALRLIGLGYAGGNTVLGDPAVTPLFDYYVDGETVDAASSPDHNDFLQRLAPAGPVGMHVLASTLQNYTRKPTLSELAEIPDVSYSLADYLLGNETCVAPNALDRFRTLPASDAFGDRKKIDACHDFASHMGSVNSTHFGTQAAATYLLHHGIALKVAARCRAMWAVVDGDPNLRGTAMYDDFKTRIVPACEREALAFEAVGSHYLGDAWSAGHMWERWGSPVFGADLETQLRQAIIGGIAGLEHGWRSVARTADQDRDWLNWGIAKVALVTWAQHDQLCMPGLPVWSLEHPLPLGGSRETLTVKATYRTGTPFDVGGDLYLLPCNATSPNDPNGAIAGSDGLAPTFATGNPYVVQYRRMVSCIAAGFDEVYAKGPGAVPTYRSDAQQPKRHDDLFDSEVRDHRADGFGTLPADPSTGGTTLFHLCFGQRATNQAMKLGSGITDWGGFDDLRIRSKLSLWFLPSKLAEKARLSEWARKAMPGRRYTDSKETPLDRAETDAAVHLVRYAFDLEQNVHDLGASGVESAAGATARTALGTPTNPEAANDILSGKVRYLEGPEPASWPAASPDSTWTCADDMKCSVTAGAPFQGTFCDRTNGVDDTNVTGRRQACMPLETAVVRAFAAGETPFHCAHDTLADFEAARLTCQQALAKKAVTPSLDGTAAKRALLDHDTPECEACAALVRPHVRASCNAAAYARAGDPKRQSECDALQAAGIEPAASAALAATTLYVPFDPAKPNGSLDAARFACVATSHMPADSGVTSAPSPAPSLMSGTCFSTCDGCTQCFGNDLVGALEKHSYPPLDNVDNAAPTLGIDAKQSALFGAESDIVDLVAPPGGSHACALEKDGTVLCVGDNKHGQLGIGDASVASSYLPRKVALSNVRRLFAVDPVTTCAVDTGDAAWCWGDNSPTASSRLAPAPFPITNIKEMAPCSRGDCALTGSGKIYYWSSLAGPADIPGVADAVHLIEGGDCYLSASGMMCPQPAQCPGPLPVNGLPFAPVEGTGNCIRSAAGDVSCLDIKQTIPQNQFCVTTIDVQKKADLPFTAQRIGGGRAAAGNALYSLGASDFGGLVFRATDAPTTCR